MILSGTRFGAIECEEGKILHFKGGLIGFREERELVLLDATPERKVAWLQSITTPALAFPVIDGASISPGYTEQDIAELAMAAGMLPENLSLLVVVSATKGRLRGNLLAPIVVDTATLMGAQLVLDAERYSAVSPLVAERGAEGGVRHLAG